ncbi:MAG: pyridoxamine 5'-phosphate oxidase family protein [Cyclobacteriaceae bacterium]
MNDSLKPSRYPNRVTHEPAEINAVLDEARFCTVAYCQDDVPFQIPTGFCRIGSKVYIHGSSKSHFLKGLNNGSIVSLSVMLYDGLILAPTAFNHSVNYRSVVLFSKASTVEDIDKKRQVLEVFVEKYVPGRMTDLENPTDEELSVTDVIEFTTDKASLKIRTGGVGVDVSKQDMWCGVIPVSEVYGEPVMDAKSKPEIDLPDYLKNFEPNNI